MTQGLPMVHLLERQSRRRGFDRYRRWTMFSMLLFLTPAISAAFTDSTAFRTYLFTLAAILGTLVPLAQLAGDGALLVSLSRERCLEEILGTRTGASEVVDQVAAHGILSVLRLGLTVIVPVLAGLLFLFPGHRLGIAASALVWIPAVAILVWVGSYVVQAAVAWTAGWGVLPAVLGYGGLVSSVGLLAAERGALSGLPWGLVALALLALVARALARVGLERPLRRPPARQRPALPPAKAARLRNPVAFREASRLRHGWVGLALLALALGGGLPLSWMALVVVQPLRASLATAGALATEREARTLEPLVLSGLSPRDFLDGWAAWSALPLVVECLVLLPVMALCGASPDLLLVLPDLLLKVGFGAWLGLCVSAWTRARRDAWSGLFLAWVGGALYLSLAPGAASSLLTTWLQGYDLARVATVAGQVASLVCTLVGLLALRSLALARVGVLFGPQGRGAT